MKVRLGIKLGLGFGMTLVVTAGLGVLAIWKMQAVAREAEKTATEAVPGVVVTSHIQQASADVFLNMRSYGLSGNAEYLTKYQAGKSLLDAAFQDGDALVRAHPNLTDLQQGLAATADAYAHYSALCADSVASRGKEQAAIKMLGPGGVNVATQAALIDAAQQDALKAGFAAGWDVEKLKNQANACRLADEIVADVGLLRIANWKCQATGDLKLIDDGIARGPALDAKLTQLATLLPLKADQDLIANLRNGLHEYRDGMLSYNSAALQTIKIGELRQPYFKAIRDGVANLNSVGLESNRTVTAASQSTLQQVCTVMGIGLGAAMMLGITLAVVITRSITKPVNRIIRALVSRADQTAAAAGQISSSSQALAQGASEQAASLEETSSSLEEISSMTKKNADSAHQANLLSADAKAIADKGNLAMSKMSGAISEIQKSASDTAKIIKTIDEIAFQTNLLALNAAVEAARAGEAGKGFAVVAEEVRNLAMRSAEAAKNTAKLIEGSVQNARNGVTIADQVAVTLGEITAASGKVNQLVAEIAAASQEQSQGIGQVNLAIQQMDKVTQSNAAAAEESAASAEELNSQGEQLRSVVENLRQLVQGAGSTPQGGVQPHSARSTPADLRKMAPAESQQNANMTISLDDEPSHLSNDTNDLETAA